MFGLLNSYNITLDPGKSFIGYPSVPLLGQRVDAFSMTTTEEKLRAISELKFPTNLADLEVYIGLTGYMRQYVHEYAQKIEPLQRLKTELLYKAPTSKGNARSYYARTTLVEPTAETLQAYKAIQAAFAKPTTLVHYAADRQLYIDLDASKRGIGVITYHLRGNPTDTAQIKNAKIQPILFMSRILSTAETRY